ncbi:CDP-6-deoxy-delta-3,4-glucoseen reductase [Caballeronia cordobensis]|uniref:CDP-6-deoxy-delta-3,4-glucoseen reductase n=1 Tax=Caballeronia cordobensis TaxID=1353886 RepID=A0A158JGI0_CABCO|nr:FAD-binding oxidoreductase [Caballeronia cordobensis]SAL67988.1 CDP-6-deoxy-delta-3,4-glucoseen reductase [Caballeronia cordobensis]
MSYQIKVAASDITFDCNDGESVLDAAERAGFALPYSCRKGVCSECQGGVVNAQGITEKALLCCVRPSANVTIAPRKIEKRERVVRKKLDASVFRIAQAAPDVTVLQLRLPTGVRAKFRAGQYLQIHLDDETVRNYSMANPPHQSDSVHLHVRHVAGGRFSDGVLKELAVGRKLRIELPYGEFFFRDESAKPVILVATGTGFAPVKSIVEDAIKRKLARPMKLYWGARREQDLYLADLARKWHDEGHVEFIPVLSDPDGDWAGRTGFVHRAVLADHPSLAAHQVYACGNPSMTSAARDAFTSAGLPEDEFFCDAFVQTGTLEPAA